jgi:hypothetical protein
LGQRSQGFVTAGAGDKRIEGYEARKGALRQQVAAAGPEASMLFAADKVSKVHELRSALTTASRDPRLVDESLLPPRRLAHLRRCLGMLQELLGAAALVELLRTELDGLDHDLGRSAATRAAA